MLSLPRRAQLAVVAHIRHTYTDYDKLLRQVPYLSARQMVERATLDKLADWRGENDEEPNVMEDILREVIVIPEDEETEGPSQDLTKARGDDEEEGIPGPVAENTLVTRPIDYGASDEAAREDSLELGEIEDARFIGHGQYIIGKQDQGRMERDGARRLRAWEEARDRLRRPRAEPRIIGILSPPKPREPASLRGAPSSQKPRTENPIHGKPSSNYHLEGTGRERASLRNPFIQVRSGGSCNANGEDADPRLCIPVQPNYVLLTTCSKIISNPALTKIIQPELCRQLMLGL